MTNLRAKVEAFLGKEVDDSIWGMLEDHGVDLEDLQLGLTTVPQLAAKVRKIDADLNGPEERPGPDKPDTELPRASEATRARIDALSAVYAAWAEAQPDVQGFREVILARSCAAMGLIPERPDGLLADGQVDSWVRWCFQQDAGGGDPQAHVMELVTRRAPHSPRPIADLWWVAGRRELCQGVDARGPLGRLAKLAETLTQAYRWRPSEATMFVLAGWRPEVFVYVGSAEIRRGHLAAATRVTMTLDPALSPEEVAGAYDRLRRRFRAGPPPRSQALRRYRLAEYVGPYVQMHSDFPASRTGPGRRPSPNAAGLAFFIEPVGDHTWESLRVGWNQLFGNQVGWEYAQANISNFTRDAKTALTRLLFPGWDTLPADTELPGNTSVETGRRA